MGKADVRRDIVVVGASAGGVEVLRALVAELPPDIAAAAFVVLHVAATGRSILPDILTRAGGPPAAHAEDGERIENGRIYVAPPDRHLLLSQDTVSLGDGPKEHGHRPAVDALFRSAARSHEARVVGVVLSGALDDGAAGLRAIKQHGGLTLVQDPEEARYPAMPRAAIASARPHEILPLAALARVLLESIGVIPGPDPSSDEEHAQKTG